MDETTAKGMPANIFAVSFFLFGSNTLPTRCDYNTRQHSATSHPSATSMPLVGICNKLQHTATATCCNTLPLQHIATACSKDQVYLPQACLLWVSATRCNALQLQRAATHW